MNTKTHLRLAGILAVVVTAFAWAGWLPAAEPGTDINALYQQGRTAYFRGDLEAAKLLLEQVHKLKPDHFETNAMLAQINTQVKADVSVKAAYGKVMLPKIDFNEVTLAEAVQALSILTKNATGGKVTPNFIVKSPTLGQKTLTLNLENVPLTHVVDYLAQMAGGRANYDKHAVVFTTLHD